MSPQETDKREAKENKEVTPRLAKREPFLNSPRYFFGRGSLFEEKKKSLKSPKMFPQDTVEQRRGAPRAGGRRETKVNEETALCGEPRELGLGVAVDHRLGSVGREDTTQEGFRAKGILTLLHSVMANSCVCPQKRQSHRAPGPGYPQYLSERMADLRAVGALKVTRAARKHPEARKKGPSRG